MPDAEMKVMRLLPFRAEHPPIEFETHVDPDGTNRRPAGAKTDSAAQVAKVQLRRALEDVAAIDERDAAEVAEQVEPHLRVQQDERVAAAREARRSDGALRAHAVERKPADRRIAADEEALARRQVFPVSTGAPASSVNCTSRGKPSASPRPTRVARTTRRLPGRRRKNSACV